MSVLNKLWDKSILVCFFSIYRLLKGIVVLKFLCVQTESVVNGNFNCWSILENHSKHDASERINIPNGLMKVDVFLKGNDLHFSLKILSSTLTFNIWGGKSKICKNERLVNGLSRESNHNKEFSDAITVVFLDKIGLFLYKIREKWQRLKM